MIQPPAPFTPVIIRVVSPPTPEVSVVDVLVNALGLTGVILAGSLVLGLAAGTLLIAYKRWHERRHEAALGSHALRLDLEPPKR